MLPHGIWLYKKSLKCNQFSSQMASLKKKLLKKHTDENTPYSPSKSVSTVNITMESIGDPDSPLSTNSPIFDGENFVLPLDQDDMDQTNFCPPRTFSPLSSSKYFAIN